MLPILTSPWRLRSAFIIALVWHAAIIYAIVVSGRQTAAPKAPIFLSISLLNSNHQSHQVESQNRNAKARHGIAKRGANPSAASNSSRSSEAADSEESKLPSQVTDACFDAAYLQNAKPVYPLASRRLGEEGKVILRVRVSAVGLPLAIETGQSSGYERLDEAARNAVEKWRFIPARKGTGPMEAWVFVPLTFHLES
jgi:TonB family protein